jgi:hypothetical protein
VLVARASALPARDMHAPLNPDCLWLTCAPLPPLPPLLPLQRYHARRKLALQRMEREVEQKVAQLALLEQENRQLKVRAGAGGCKRLLCCT